MIWLELAILFGGFIAAIAGAPVAGAVVNQRMPRLAERVRRQRVPLLVLVAALALSGLLLRRFGSAGWEDPGFAASLVAYALLGFVLLAAGLPSERSHDREEAASGLPRSGAQPPSRRTPEG